MLAESRSTLAHARASEIADRNLAALRERQPLLATAIEPFDQLDVEWVLARDGSLSARDEDAWISGSSVPSAAASAQLKRFELQGPVGCFLFPAHAAAVRVALDRMQPEQAVIAIVSTIRELSLMLGCADFSRDIRANRLWFIAGEYPDEQLSRLFDEQPGLSVPTQFIRLNTAPPELVDQLIPAAQKVFSEVTAQRAEAIRAARERWAPRSNGAPSRLCILAPSQFRLWNDWGATLASSFDDADCVRVDTDDPCSVSPLAVSRAAERCDAVVTIDMARSDARNVLPDAMPWVTFAASGRIPAFDAAGRRDQLVLLDVRDRPAAMTAGWSDAQLHTARAPAISRANSTSHHVAIIADTSSLEPPASIDDFSSHRPLWGCIADELTRNPFALGDDVEQYLTSRMRKFEVADETLNRPAFIARLIISAYQQGVVRVLTDAGVPLKVFGKGWDAGAGPINSREEFQTAVRGAKLLLHVWPDKRVHPIDFVGLPVARIGRTRQALLRDLQNPSPPANCSLPTFCADFVRQILARATAFGS